MRKSYPSDITRERFEAIRPILEGGQIVKQVQHPYTEKSRKFFKFGNFIS